MLAAPPACEPVFSYFDCRRTDGFCNHTDMIADDELHEYFTRLLRNASLLLYGRTTYQLMVPYWPDVARNQPEPGASNDFALEALAGSINSLFPELSGG